MEIKPTSTTPLKIAPAFEPTKTPNPAQTAPAQSSDAAAAKTEPVSKPGRWKPPGDIVEGESAKKEEPPKVEAAAVAPTPVKTEPETAPVVSADVAAPEQKAETQHQEERKQEQQVQEEPARVVVPPAEKEEKKKEEKKKEEKADEKKPVVDDWENVNTAELGREVEERVAAAIKVEEKPAEEETPKKIRYDDVSYNPAAEHAGKKKYTKDFLMQFKPLYTVKPQDLRETLEIVENSGARQEESRDHSKDGNRSDDRGSNQRGYTFCFAYLFCLKKRLVAIVETVRINREI